MRNPRRTTPIAGPEELARRIAARRYPVQSLRSVAALVAALGSATAHAAVATVTNKNDAGPGSLRDLIAQANLNPGADTINFAAHVTGVITLQTGEIDINTDELTIDGPGAKILAISGNNAGRIFDIAGSAPSVAIRRLTLTKGRTTDNGIDQSGGAVRSFADLTLTDSVVTGNATNGNLARGGGVSVYDGNLTLNNTTVSGNTTSGFGAEGGGLYVYGGALMLNDSTVTGNSTAGANGYGGGVRVEFGTATLTGSSVSGNSTTGSTGRGAGLSAVNSGVILNDSIISGNSATGLGGLGGGLHVVNASATLTNSTISGNSTAGKYGFGGGLRVEGGNVTLTASTVSGNSTAGEISPGGGLSVSGGNISLTSSAVFGNSTTGANSAGAGIFQQMGDLALTNSTVSGNTVGAAVGGSAGTGGLYVVSGNATLINSTIALNRGGGTADGVYVQGTFTVDNSIIAQAGSEVPCGKTIDAGSNNLATDGSCGAAATTTSLAALNLGGLADNGGLTRTHALLSGSAAINAGSDGVCDDVPPGPNSQDQRGVSRFISGNCDIGAYELNPSAPSLACPLTPDMSCTNLATATLTAKRGKTPKLSFNASGDTTSDAALFGNPKAGTGNLLCVYQEDLLDSQHRVPAPLTGLIWRFDPLRGVATYAERFGVFDGVTSIRQTPGASGKVRWVAKGDRTLDVQQPPTLPVRVQNQNTNGGCAEGLFDQPAHVIKNDGITLTLKRKP